MGKKGASNPFLLRPPACLKQFVEENVDGKKVEEEAPSVQSRLREIFTQVRDENATFQRIMYKNQNQHRRTVYFRHLLQGTDLLALEEQRRVIKALEDFREQHPDSVRLGIYGSACEFSGACHSSGSFDDVGRVAVRYFIRDNYGFHSGHATVAFRIARYFARDRILKLAENNPKFLAIDKAIGADSFRVVTLLRLSPLLPFSLGNYLYGLTSVELVPYVLGSWLGMLPGTWAYETPNTNK